ncbi:MAG: thioredoxin domain-containing protein [Pseudolabrys sp.]|nr:thioredoxin domain-containing protein [Pseudolabrys sp.]MDP2295805.1 thioredoxin domain-containing protein [Pseudolabrys sp.]
MRLTRREFCQSTATVALATALGLATVPAFTGEALAQAKVSEVELMAPGALPEMVMGDAKATVTVIEYASMTCSHCATFAEKTFPEFKKRYVDTGKVRYIFREFPLDQLAAAAFMLARCSAETDSDKYFTFVDTMFRQQRVWAVEKPLPPLLALAKQAGFTQATFDACLTNQKLLEGIEAVRNRGAEKFKVQSTPSFFINGTLYAGALSIEDMAKHIDPLLKG